MPVLILKGSVAITAGVSISGVAGHRTWHRNQLSKQRHQHSAASKKAGEEGEEEEEGGSGLLVVHVGGIGPGCKSLGGEGGGRAYSSLICIIGALVQAPRHSTSRTVKRPSSVVSPLPMPSSSWTFSWIGYASHTMHGVVVQICEAIGGCGHGNGPKSGPNNHQSAAKNACRQAALACYSYTVLRPLSTWNKQEMNKVEIEAAHRGRCGPRRNTRTWMKNFPTGSRLNMV